MSAARRRCRARWSCGPECRTRSHAPRGSITRADGGARAAHRARPAGSAAWRRWRIARRSRAATRCGSGMGEPRAVPGAERGCVLRAARGRGDQAPRQTPPGRHDEVITPPGESLWNRGPSSVLIGEVLRAAEDRLRASVSSSSRASLPCACSSLARPAAPTSPIPPGPTRIPARWSARRQRLHVRMMSCCGIRRESLAGRRGDAQLLRLSPG